jgi:hypothetical protein
MEYSLDPDLYIHHDILREGNHGAALHDLSSYLLYHGRYHDHSYQEH